MDNLKTIWNESGNKLSAQNFVVGLNH